MRALSKRVHAGIGSPSAVNSYLAPANLAKGPLQLVLHSFSMFLTLPAGEVRTVVGNDQLEPLRHRDLLMDFRRVGRVLQAIKIALQDHLGRNLIDIAAGIARFLAGIAHGPVCGDGC